MTAEDFFLHRFQEVILSHPISFMECCGSITFAIPEQGDWTIRLGDLDQPVSRGFFSIADLRLWFSAECFLDFLNGDLDLETALETGDLAAQGDLSLFDTLHYFAECLDTAQTA